MLYTPRPRDCSAPYKKFYELNDGDKIYNILIFFAPIGGAEIGAIIAMILHAYNIY